MVRATPGRSLGRCSTARCSWFSLFTIGLVTLFGPDYSGSGIGRPRSRLT